MGEDAYDLICSECNKNFGRGYLDDDNHYYMFGYEEGGDYYHNIYNSNVKWFQLKSVQ